MKYFPLKSDRVPLLTIQEKALRRLLPDELLIDEIGILLYENKVDRQAFYEDITEACKAGQLKYNGEIDSGLVDYEKWATNYRKVKFPDKHYELLGYSEKQGIDNACLEAYWRIVDREIVDVYEVLSPPHCLIHRDELANYLKSIELWPVTDCLLINWWYDSFTQRTDQLNEITKPKISDVFTDCDEKSLSEEEIITKPQIIKIFIKRTSDQWRGYFQRDLKKMRIEGENKSKFKISDICRWLKEKGYYTEAEIQNALMIYAKPSSELNEKKKSPTKNNSLGHDLGAKFNKK
jgi:hypothetical protein